MSEIYTGIGSRETPKDILTIFTLIGMELGDNNFILRSGAADGADSAFEKGADLSRFQRKEIFLPWRRFNDSESKNHEIPDSAYEMAATYFKNWSYFKPYVKSFMARNCQQVLGKNLDTPTDFIVCYTDGGKLLGGTAMAIRVATENKIKIFNAGSYSSIEEFTKDLYNYIKDRYNIEIAIR